ncbi:MAG: 50S ribosomal protein L20 [Candidatus Paceibacterota bacterium]
MTRVKRGVTSIKRRRNILRQAKGYRFGRGNKEREAKQAIIKAGMHAYAHRKDKKGDFRTLWNIKINAQIREQGGLSYSRFIDALKKRSIGINRKMLADLAEHHPETFSRIVERVKHSPSEKISEII